MERHFETEIVAIEKLLQEVERHCLDPAVFAQKNAWVKRLTEGQLAFMKGDYEHAAMALLGPLEAPDADHLQGYSEAIYYLAESLYQVSNYGAALKYFEKALQQGGEYEKQSLARVLELSLKNGDEKAIWGHLKRSSQLLSDPQTDPQLLYDVAKFYYEHGELGVSRTLFSTIPVEHRTFAKARYFLGVIELCEQHWEAALERFQHCAEVDALKPEDQEIRDLAYLALGRLYYEQNRFQESVQAYASIPYDSLHFDETQYEHVWLAIREGDYAKALIRLDIWMNSAELDHIDPELRVMRGRLLFMRSDLEQAEAYMSALPEEFDGYLQRMTEAFEEEKRQRAWQNESPDRWRLPIRPEQVVHFIQPDEDFERLQKLEDELGVIQREVVGTDYALSHLERVVQLPSRVRFFEDLYVGFVDAQEALIRSMQLRRMLIENQEREFHSQALERLIAQRQKLNGRLSQIPETAELWRSREKQLEANLNKIDDSAFEIEREITGLEAQLTVLEQTIRGATGNARETLSQWMAELKAASAEQKQLLERVKTLRAESVEQRLSFGEKDSVAVSDEKLLRRYQDALNAELRLLSQMQGAPAPEWLARLDRLDARNYSILKQISEIAESRMLGIALEIARERKTAERSKKALKALQERVLALEAKSADRSFNDAIALLDNIALEARYTLLWGAWKRKETLQGNGAAHDQMRVQDPDNALSLEELR